MLISSHRHKPVDLELWAELEAADHAHAATLLQSGKIERSQEAIADFVSQGPCYLSISWGKDSVALADLCLAIIPSLRLVYLNAGRFVPAETIQTKGRFHANRLVVNMTEVFLSYPQGSTEGDKDRIFYEAFHDQPEKRHISGVRAEESAARKIRCRRWGLNSPNASAPLAWWTNQDVFSYLCVRGLPIHPNYAMLGGGRWRREQLRVDELAGERGDQFGRREWEQEYYPDILRRLEAVR